MDSLSPLVVLYDSLFILSTLLLLVYFPIPPSRLATLNIPRSCAQLLPLIHPTNILSLSTALPHTARPRERIPHFRSSPARSNDSDSDCLIAIHQDARHIRHSNESPIPSHGAFFGSGDLDRSPSIRPTFQSFTRARLSNACRQDGGLRAHGCGEQHLLIEHAPCGRRDMGLAARYVPAAQSHGIEFRDDAIQW